MTEKVWWAKSYIFLTKMVKKFGAQCAHPWQDRVKSLATHLFKHGANFCTAWLPFCDDAIKLLKVLKNMINVAVKHCFKGSNSKNSPFKLTFHTFVTH